MLVFRRAPFKRASSANPPHFPALRPATGIAFFRAGTRAPPRGPECPLRGLQPGTPSWARVRGWVYGLLLGVNPSSTLIDAHCAIDIMFSASTASVYVFVDVNIKGASVCSVVRAI